MHRSVGKNQRNGYTGKQTRKAQLNFNTSLCNKTIETWCSWRRLYPARKGRVGSDQLRGMKLISRLLMLEGLISYRLSHSARDSMKIYANVSLNYPKHICQNDKKSNWFTQIQRANLADTLL